jgi:hypothetical protein
VFALVGGCPLTSLKYITNLKILIMMNFGNSPLLDMGTNQQQQPQMMDAELQKMYEAIQQKRASINMQAQQSSTPLWDEIDKIEDNLTGAQRQYLMQNQKYVDSLQYVSKLVQDEELRIIRPRIESTQQGQEALKKHLSLMQRLRKEVAQAEEQKSAMLNDYMTNHSDKTWQEYLAMVQGAKKGGNKK